jgi:hypothetical protein
MPAAGHLPPALFDMYLRYKKDTNAVTSWLVQHGSEGVTAGHKYRIQELVILAHTVRSKGVALPGIIAYHFREAISARRALSAIFRRLESSSKGSQVTQDHERFTSWQVSKMVCQEVELISG